MLDYGTNKSGQAVGQNSFIEICFYSYKCQNHRQTKLVIKAFFLCIFDVEWVYQK